MRKTISVAVLSAAAALLVNGLISKYNSQTETPPTSSPVLASVAGRPITEEAFMARMIRRSGGSPGAFSSTEKKKQLLDEMIDYQLQVVRARELGYAQDPEMITRMERIMVSKLREEELGGKLAGVTVDKDEIEEYYQQHLADYTTPAMSRIAAIQIRVANGARDEKRAELKTRAEEILQQAAKLPDSTRGFGALAAQHSEHQPSRYIGGDVGWFSAEKGGRFKDPAILQAVASLKQVGELSPVVEAEDGYYLLKLLDLRAEKVKPVAEVEGQIKYRLLAQKRAEAEAAWLAGLRTENTPVKIDLSALEAIQPPQGATVQKKNLKPANMPNG